MRAYGPNGALWQRRQDLIAYAASCLAAEDWHGLRDAAVDIECAEARIDEIARQATRESAAAIPFRTVAP